MSLRRETIMSELRDLKKSVQAGKNKDVLIKKISYLEDCLISYFNDNNHYENNYNSFWWCNQKVIL